VNGLGVVALIWVGMLLGVSFLATPAKFLAPSLALSVALDVGRHTFAIFSIVEVLGAVVLLLCSIASRSGRYPVFAALLVGGLVAAQFVWLLPALDARVEIILQGGVPDSSGLHTLYIIMEVGKVALLSLVAWSSFRVRHHAVVRLADAG